MGFSGISTPLQRGLRVLIHAQSQEEGDLSLSAVPRLQAISRITDLSSPRVHLPPTKAGAVSRYPGVEVTYPQVRGWPRPTGPTISLPEKLSYHLTSSEEAEEEEEGEPGRLGARAGPRQSRKAAEIPGVHSTRPRAQRGQVFCYPASH